MNTTVTDEMSTEPFIHLPPTHHEVGVLESILACGYFWRLAKFEASLLLLSSYLLPPIKCS
jgi:hypothetical protein